MAKNFKRLAALGTALVMCAGMMTVPVFAKENNRDRDRDRYDDYFRPGTSQGGSQSSNEWYKVYVEGVEVASGAGKAGNVLWLGQTYKANVSISGSTLTWSIKPNGGNSGNFGGSVDLTKYINIPEGYEIPADGFSFETKSIEGVNSQSNQYDNCVISVTIKAIYNPVTQETIPVETLPQETEPEPTEPEPTEPEPTEPEPTEPEPTEPEPTEPEPTEPEPTEPEPTEPEPTEPEPTEPEPTEPEPTEPEPTEPEPTEPEPTEPEPTEPEPTEPEPTEPEPTEPEPTEPEPTEPEPTEPEPTETPTEAPAEPAKPAKPSNPDPSSGDGLVDIFDEDVPLANVPKTGDISALWLALSSLSAGGLALLNKKRKS